MGIFRKAAAVQVQKPDVVEAKQTGAGAIELPPAPQPAVEPTIQLINYNDIIIDRLDAVIELLVKQNELLEKATKNA